MKNLSLLVLILFLAVIKLTAQDNHGWINEKKALLFEKLYVQTDREMYSSFDKIWLKAYQVNAITHELNSNYRNIFVQLVAEDGRVVKDLLLFSIKGQAHGCISTDSVPSGRYTLRAFTKYLQTFGEEACFHRKIWITDLPKPATPQDKLNAEYPVMEVAFLPEGGHMVLNAANTVAFKAIGQDGKGMDVSGRIIDEQGDTIVAFKSSYKGMGKLIMMPVEGKTYFAVIDQNPTLKIRLEKAIEQGVNLRVIDKGSSLLFVMGANMKQSIPFPFYLMITHKGNVSYGKIQMDGFTYTLTVDKNELPEGISKISLLDTMKNPFAERLIFVDKGDSDLVLLQMDKQEYQPREKVTINADAELEPGDSLNSALSVAVVNQKYFGNFENSQTIKSYLLLDAELKGPIEFPSDFFINDKQLKSAEKLDLLMMVNGWRSYIWEDVKAVDTTDLVAWNDAGIEIKGYVKKLLWKAPLPDAELTLATRGGNFTIEKTNSNQLGRFSFKRIFLSSVTRVTINALTKNGTRNAEIKLDEEFRMDTVINVGSMKNTSFDVDYNAGYYRANSNRRMKEMEFNPENGTILLEEVNIRQKRSIMDDGHFRLYSRPDNSLTITESDYQYSNVLDYLEGKVGGLLITGDNVSIRGGGMPVFLVDGIEIEDFNDPTRVLREVRNIRMTEIDKVEVLKSAANMAMFGSHGGNGVIAIYRKTVDVPYADTYQNGRVERSINGFHKAPKFYSPTYTLDNINNPEPDYRPTLLWDPELSFKDGEAEISFYTADEPARYVVYVEGISKNGRICYGTTHFSVTKE